MFKKGFVIAGTNSGCGKTTLTLALMAWLTRRGCRVAPFKIGPDFIDPGHHTRITGTISRNLDGWMLSRDYNLSCFQQQTTGRIAVVEGVMGLFDGYDGKTEAGSTAQMAKWLNLPVILVVNARSMARSAAALVQGFERFDPNLTFAGVIFNQLGSPRHLKYLEDALEDTVQMPCLGGIQRNEALAIPERHLGLVTTDDHFMSDDHINQLADLIENNLHPQRMASFLPEVCRTSAHPIETADEQNEMNRFAGDNKTISAAAETKEPPVRLAIARDNAFCFYYQDNLDMLAAAGAERVCFSPLEDAWLPPDLDGIYLGGGYPELFAEKLAANETLRRQILAASHSGMPIYGECGGFMYLCTNIEDLNGHAYAMSGCLPFSTRMLNRLKTLGYREISVRPDTLMGETELTARGHEFHYSEIINPEAVSQIETVYTVTPRIGVNRKPEGYWTRNTLGSYIHLHFGSNPDIPEGFVAACRNYRKQRKTES